jgi:hypothetical protein
MLQMLQGPLGSFIIGGDEGDVMEGHGLGAFSERLAGV